MIYDSISNRHPLYHGSNRHHTTDSSQYSSPRRSQRSKTLNCNPSSQACSKSFILKTLKPPSFSQILTSLCNTNDTRMGRVRTKTLKKSSYMVIQKYNSRMTVDSHTNIKILEEVASIPSKCLCNRIVGFRIQRG